MRKVILFTACKTSTFKVKWWFNKVIFGEFENLVEILVNHKYKDNRWSSFRRDQLTTNSFFYFAPTHTCYIFSVISIKQQLWGYSKFLEEPNSFLIPSVFFGLVMFNFIHFFFSHFFSYVFFPVFFPFFFSFFQFINPLSLGGHFK